MTLAQIRAAMAAKQAEIRAKIAELNGAPSDKVTEIEAAHDALVAEYDVLSRSEARLVAAEARDAQLAAQSRSGGGAAGAGDGAGAATGEGAGGGETRGAAALTAAQGLALMDEGRGYGLPDTDLRTMVAVASATEQSVRQAILTAAAERQRQATGTVTGSGATVLTDERQIKRAAMENALLHRHSPGAHALTDPAREFRGMTLMDMGREALSWIGENTRGMNRNELATRALMSTSDFPNILANVTSRTLRDAYAASPRTFMPLGRQITLSDFKAAHRVKLGDAPQLIEVLEDGEFKRGAMGESDEQIKLRTFGRVVGITRQVIINDDLGAFTRIPEMFGNQAANLESNIVWALILSNPTLLTDNTPLFHAKHNNLFTGGGANPAAALSVTSVGLARTAMAKQVGDGEGATPLNVRPGFLVGPSELEIAMQQLLFGITPQQTSQVVPDAIRTLTPISEPRLSTGINGILGSATAWYLFADPATIDTFEYAYLEGQSGPYTESRNGFDVDGVEIKCRHDFGAAAIDYRGVSKNVGA